MAAAGSILGNAVLRKEDPGLLRGENDYIDDMDVGAKAVAFVRSTIAHGTINSIDVGDAPNMPGVIAVYTSDNTDLPGVKGFDAFPDTFDRPPLAKGKVKFVGDIIAMIVAETQSQAVDAAEAVFADIEPLDPVIDIASAAGAAAIHELSLIHI